MYPTTDFSRKWRIANTLLILLFLSFSLQGQVKISNNSTQADTSAIFQVEANDGTKFHINITDGKVGINTKNPDKALDINGELRIRSVHSGTTMDSILSMDNTGVVRMISVNKLMKSLMVINTDNQGISLNEHILTLEDGGTVDLTAFLDNTDNQGLSLEGNILTLENGGTVDLTAFLDNTDDQSITLVGNTLQLENGGSIDLSPFLDDTDTDDQGLSLDGNILTLEDGGT
ncbi:MAG: hypothetical protein P1U56_07710, partial [Saprospiraceae bacterium]|nr:hypothetical protein [Saprospiraceae bacterium]